MPLTAAFEAHKHSALALSLISATARPSHHLSTSRLGAPLKILVFANLNILSYILIRFCDLFGAKSLDMLGFKTLFATESHARDIHRFAVDYTVLEMVSCAVDAEIVPTRQCEKAFR